MIKLPLLIQVVGLAVLLSPLLLPAQQSQPCSSANDTQDCKAPPTAEGPFRAGERNQVKTTDPRDGSEGDDDAERLNRKYGEQLARKRAAEKPTDFEEFVKESLGYKLPIFGRELFSDSPTTFAPLADVPVPAEYVVGPGDELIIRGWGQIEINARVTVDRSGQIFLPKVGTISVTGVRYADLHDHLEQSIRRVFHDFELNVSLGKLRSIQIFVVGQARRPGSYTVSSLSTMVTALFASGGPSARGSLRRVELRRGEQTITTLDLYALLLKGDKSHDVNLLPGDVIYIPAVGPMVAMAGSVNVPAIYELLPGTTLEQGIEYAGGLSNTADQEKASVERIAQHHSRRVDDVRLNGLEKAFQLADGDVVRLIPISPAIEDAVTLRGNVAQPGRYQWHVGMRVHDLIPSREFLLTREYWLTKNALINDEQREIKSKKATDTNKVDLKDRNDDENDDDLKPEDQEDDAQKQDKDTDRKEDDKTRLRRQKRHERRDESEFATDVKRNAPELNWEYAAVQRTNPADLTSELLPFNLAKAIDGDGENNLELKAGDVVTIFSDRDIAVANAKKTKLVRLEGEFAAPGVYRCAPGETLRQLVTRIGLTSESYLYGAEFTRESTRLQQQASMDRMVMEMEKSLGQVQSQRAAALTTSAAEVENMQSQRDLVTRLRSLRATGRIVLSLPPDAHEPQQLPNIILEDGDRFAIPHQPATVGVTGEVFNQGAFLHTQKSKLRDYLRNAGGPTRNADVSRMFVLRADGTVISRQRNSMWSNKFEELRLYPGDTIIAPSRLDRGAFMRGLRDWSQVMSQFALGAAAIKVLQ
jgi:polysaccharide biosynthesis/export protein